MPTQNVNLTETQSEFIRRSVESGAYNNASEVVRDALRLLKATNEEREARLAILRAELQKGLDSIERGRYTELDSREEIDALGREISRRGRERLTKELDAPSASTE